MASPLGVIKKEAWIADQKLVIDSIKTDNFETISKKVFEFLRDNAPKDAKCAVMDAYVAKYGERALGEIYQHSYLEFGFNMMDKLDDIAKKKPNTLTYMQSLAYGFAISGYEGFRAAARLVASQIPDILLFGANRTPLSGSIALMACTKLVKDGKLDREKAIGHLTEYLESSKLSMETKGTLLSMMKMIDPNALQKLLTNPKIDGQTKDLIREMTKTPREILKR